MKYSSFGRAASAIAFAAASAAASEAGATLTLAIDPSIKGDLTYPAYQQTKDDPCIFGHSDCKSAAGWQYVSTPTGLGNDSYDVQLWSYGTEPVLDKNKTKCGSSWCYDPEYTNAQDWTAGSTVFYSYNQLWNVLTCGAVDCGVTPDASIGFFIGIDQSIAGKDKPQYLYEFDIYECAGTPTPMPALTGSPAPCSLLAQFSDAGGYLMDTDTGTGYSNYILSASGLQFRAGYNYSFFTHYSANDGPDSFFLINEGTLPCIDCGTTPAPATLALLGAGVLSLIGIQPALRRRGRVSPSLG